MKTLVTDFDGTMTKGDFYRLALERLVPTTTPDHWSEYRRGTITHFEALRRYFAAITADEREVLEVVEQMELDPSLPEAVAALRARGWKVVVASAGCEWYIGKLLRSAGVELEVHANPGHFTPGEGLILERPVDSPYACESLGVDKARIVRTHLARGGRVAFAGDGFPDAEAARLVPADSRFARADLAALLEEHGLEYRQFDAWSDIARMLLEDV